MKGYKDWKESKILKNGISHHLLGYKEADGCIFICASIVHEK